jgi:hypothetical protein
VKGNKVVGVLGKKIKVCVTPATVDGFEAQDQKKRATTKQGAQRLKEEGVYVCSLTLLNWWVLLQNN